MALLISLVQQCNGPKEKSHREKELSIHSKWQSQKFDEIFWGPQSMRTGLIFTKNFTNFHIGGHG